MTNQLKREIKISGLVLLTIYFSLVSVSDVMTKIEAVAALCISLGLVFKSKNSIPLMLGMLFIAYSIYSIVIGEYIVGGKLGAALLQVKTPEIYGMTMRITLLFLFTLFIFFPKVNQLTLPLPKENLVIFSILIMGLIFIGIFGINRQVSMGYSVHISPIYEFSIILFLFAYHASGDKWIRKAVILLLMLFFIAQDYFFGGRITALQIILVAMSTIFKDHLTKKVTILFVFLGIVLNSAVGTIRSSLNAYGFNIFEIIKGLLDNLFVFDTPVYAYYASATHVATIHILNIAAKVRWQSFVNFVQSILIGGQEDSGNVTIYVSKNYFFNLGGGIYPTHFYFWLGWVGVILSALIVAFIIKKITVQKSELSGLIAVIVISSLPRWFLYNPLILFRMIFFVVLAYILFTIGHVLTLNLNGEFWDFKRKD